MLSVQAGAGCEEFGTEVVLIICMLKNLAHWKSPCAGIQALAAASPTVRITRFRTFDGQFTSRPF